MSRSTQIKQIATLLSSSLHIHVSMNTPITWLNGLSKTPENIEIEKSAYSTKLWNMLLFEGNESDLYSGSRESSVICLPNMSDLQQYFSNEYVPIGTGIQADFTFFNNTYIQVFASAFNVIYVTSI